MLSVFLLERSEKVTMKHGINEKYFSRIAMNLSRTGTQSPGNWGGNDASHFPGNFPFSWSSGLQPFPIVAAIPQLELGPGPMAEGKLF